MKCRPGIGMLRRDASTPTRGPWIEMSITRGTYDECLVGPHTGAVD